MTLFTGQTTKGQGHQAVNAVAENQPDLRNEKANELQTLYILMEYDYPHH